MKRIVVLLLFATACGPVQDPSKSSKSLAADDRNSDVSPADCSQPPLAGPSEACCPGHGLDACGANLFCAALDGRSLATCYVTRSQPAGAECNDDQHCQSEACGPDDECLALPGQSCAAGEACHQAVCVDDICVPTTGESGAPCEEDGQCGDGRTCNNGMCVVEIGSACLGSSMLCESRYCVDGRPQTLDDICSECRSNADCEAHNGNFEVCESGRCVHTCQHDGHCDLLNINCSSAGVDCNYACFDGVCRQ